MSHSSIQFLLTLIDDIFDYSKIKLGYFKFENQWVNLTGLIEDIFNIVSAHADLKKVSLKYKIDFLVP